MSNAFTPVIEKCKAALGGVDPQRHIAAILLQAAKDPAVVEAISKREGFSDLGDLAIHRNADLTLLAGSLPPGFSVGPHNHNLWPVVGCVSARKTMCFREER